MSLRQRGISQREECAGGVRDQAPHRALCDECGRMLKREDNHCRAAGGRQRRDERTDEWTAALHDD
jgi:hypothetical protein